MPGWHEATKVPNSKGQLALFGIVQEQHPDRARLFMDWKQMSWPVAADPLNLIEVAVVPLAFGIDEAGVIRAIMRRPNELASFMQLPAVKLVTEDSTDRTKPTRESLGRAAQNASPPDRPSQADALLLWGGKPAINDAVAAYETVLKQQPADPATHFKLGVALRQRLDHGVRVRGDFQRAAAEWGKALELDPNNYIWRRRIQQYGPRLSKPYAFYDWVDEARSVLLARGSEPPELQAEPSGAEIAQPSKSFQSTDRKREPDKKGRIKRDKGKLVEVETTLVPVNPKPGASARVHIALQPLSTAHWNNEAKPLELWLTAPKGWQLSRRQLTVPNPTSSLTTEKRSIEFELQSDEDIKPGPHELSAYALYYVCEDSTSICLYRRQDLKVDLVVK